MDLITLIRRTAAAGAGASGILHLLMLGHGDHLGWSMFMVAMAIVCLPCAGHLWRTASSRSWMLIGLMNAGMLAVHMWLLGSTPPGPAEPALPNADLNPAHSHGETALGLAGTHELLLPLASAAAILEILLAGVGLHLLHRLHRVSRTTTVQAQHSLLQGESSP
ncbi:hypothetical protein [Nesterenkonia lutea]|uniref:Uncharacterized protein n=1 Tax=Nesterenkonia lutea TaxID=272919 RepID=A0ABR9JDD1_9MICC|nr:hypothetical protein [Nesterenkonia lutea]MBE1523940.1 hypothetical protein [Nesterenkonia lutea]